MKYLQFIKLVFPVILVAGLSSCGGAAPAGAPTGETASSVAPVVPASSSKSSTAASVASSNAADTQAPTMPTSLMLGSTPTTNSVTINWSQASDNVEVTSYQIYRDSQLISTALASTQTMIDGTVTANRSYVYGVKAGDAAGNWSSMKTLIVNTPAPISGTQSSASSITQTSSTGLSKASSSKASSLVASSSRASSLVASSVSSSRAASSSSSSAQSTHSTTLGWMIPTQRENGDPMLSSEIGGYSIRYTSSTTGAVSTLNVSGGTSVSATINSLTGTYTFEIATYDTAGLYSDYALIGVK